MKFLWAVYLAGAAFAIWRTDAHWPTRLGLAVLWPVGPAAFLVTVAILLAASLVAFPLVGGVVAAGAAAAWWLFA